MVTKSIVPKWVCRFNAILIKIREQIFEDVNKLNLKYIEKGTGPRIAKIILKRKKKWEILSTLY